MPKWNTVAIIGVGLIGGSIGLALRQRKLAQHIVGIGRRPATLAAALSQGCVTRTTTSVPEGVAAAQMIVIATPVELIAAYAAEASQHAPAGAILTDVGSTKADIVHSTEAALADLDVDGISFVGSHPLAGSEKTGHEFAKADLFEGKVVVVTPLEGINQNAALSVQSFWESLGARVVRMTPEEHDAALARTSHFPHLVASALAAATPGDLLPLTAGGWLDTTRIAAGDAELWRQILLTNRSHTLKALADFETVLERFRAALEAGDGPTLQELLAEGKTRRDAVGS